MCLIHAHFKHFARGKAKQFRHRGKVSSIMPAGSALVTSG
jgi:hypothetical protein